jgi:glutamate synthase domain-containing protein 1
MCGIVGLYFKKNKFHKNLGKYLSGMLDNMSSRGPDSAGFAIYNNDAKKLYKYSLCINDNLIIDDLKTDINMKFKDVTFKSISDHLVVQTLSSPKSFIPYLKKNIIIY